MKKFILITGFLVGICFLILWRFGFASHSKNSPATSEVASHSRPASESVSARKDRGTSFRDVRVTNADYVKEFREIADSLNPESLWAKDLILSWGAMFAISDLLMDNPIISDEAIIERVANKSGMPVEEIGAMVQRYPRSRRSLEEHYEIILENEQLQAVKDVYDRLGIRFDPRSDCLIDGFRFAAGYLQMKQVTEQMRGSAEWMLQGASGESERLGREWLTSATNEQIEGCQATMEAFYGRFVGRHRMDPQMARSLLAELSNVIVYDVGPGELNVPRPEFGGL